MNKLFMVLCVRGSGFLDGGLEIEGLCVIGGGLGEFEVQWCIGIVCYCQEIQVCIFVVGWCFGVQYFFVGCFDFFIGQ